MRIHYLQHVPFEGLGYIEEWARENKHGVTVTRLFESVQFPLQNQFDFLIVMGGPMSIHDVDRYSWLTEEKVFIKACLKMKKPVLGICLGAQLLADALGARVYAGNEKEIGWFPIIRSKRINPDLAEIFPMGTEVFHWHGETFELPQGAIHLAESDACRNQGFIWNERVIALQFHLESTRESVGDLIKNCAAELVKAPYIQTAEQMLADENNFVRINKLMKDMLDYLSGLV